jgi:DNA-binding LacI/PurR family transcriptional regulator
MSYVMNTSKEKKGVKYLEIATHFRNLINSGQLKSGTRLPTAKNLAVAWGTNHSTIQTALEPLVKEGLIERKRRHGTYVRNRTTQISTVAVYFGSNLWFPDHNFYQLVYNYLDEIYEKRNGRTLLFIDKRPSRDQAACPPKLQKMVDRREVQGVIGLMLSKGTSGWLRELSIPTSLFGSSDIHSDSIEITNLALTLLAAEGCRTVGFVHPSPTPTWNTVFKSIARQHGMQTNPHWLQDSAEFQPSNESFGYKLFKRFWSRPNRPDGIFVFPDTTCRGAITAALELGLNVPRDLRMVLHRNLGIDYLCPWKVPYVVTDVKEVATLLANHLDAQLLETVPPLPVVSARIVIE